MTFSEYQRLASRTANPDLISQSRRLNYAIGLGESGGIQNAVKKHIFHDHDFAETRGEILDEAGDLLWYLAMLAEAYGLDLEQIARVNVAKLQSRYPNGFCKEASQNRGK